MSPRHPRSPTLPGEGAPPVGFRDELRSIRGLTPYLWPRDRPDLRLRVALALLCLIVAKFVNITVPLLYKQAVDALTPGHSAVVVVPVALVIAYGIARISAQAFGELRDAIFAKVEQHAVRMVGLTTFRHLHGLSLRFHLERQTGGISRAIEPGIPGIEFLLSFMLFNVVPTLFEILLVCGVLWRLYNVEFAIVTFAPLVFYIAFTFVISDWRIKYRREIDQRGNEAHTKANDSPPEFETAKDFPKQEHE